MSVIDLKPILLYYGHSVINFYKGVANEYRENDFRSSHGFFTVTRISQMRQTLSRQLQTQKLFMLRPIFVHGLCAANLPRKFARHRNVPVTGANFPSFDKISKVELDKLKNSKYSVDRVSF